VRDNFRTFFIKFEYMALPTLIQMVKNNLPFLPTDNSKDAVIQQYIIEAMYYLQPWTLLSNTDVEDESKYSSLQKMLIAQLVGCNLITNQALLNVGGAGGGSGTGAKRIKKGKADVVEAEFDYGKADDGSFLGLSAEKFLNNCKMKACEYAATLNYSLPMCNCGKVYDTPAFIAFENDKLNCSCG